MKLVKISIITFIIGLSVLSCKDNFYAENYSFDDGWHKDSILDFTIDVQEPKANYDIYFTVRNDDNYPYRNLYIFTKLDNEIDTLEYELADQYGKWVGNGMGGTKELTLRYKENYHFSSEGENHLYIEQGMRQDTLYGIKDISVLIEKK